MPENNIFEYIFGIEDDMTCQINNQNFYDNINEYYQMLYSALASTPAWKPGCTAPPTTVFNENGCDNNTEYEICNGMSDFFFVFLTKVYPCATKKFCVLCFLFWYLVYSVLLFTCLLFNNIGFNR